MKLSFLVFIVSSTLVCAIWGQGEMLKDFDVGNFRIMISQGQDSKTFISAVNLKTGTWYGNIEIYQGFYDLKDIAFDNISISRADKIAVSLELPLYNFPVFLKAKSQRNVKKQVNLLNIQVRDFAMANKLQRTEIEDLQSQVDTLSNKIDEITRDLRILQNNSAPPQDKKYIESGLMMENDFAAMSPEFLLDKGFGPRSRSFHVTFKKSFPAVPDVAVSLNYLDSAGQPNLRIAMRAQNITLDGFDVRYDTWGDTVIYGYGVSWIAYET